MIYYLYIVSLNGEIYKMNPKFTLSEFLSDAKKNLKKPDFINFCNDFIINYSFIKKDNNDIILNKENKHSISKKLSFNINENQNFEFRKISF